jgi:hypothetical protein
MNATIDSIQVLGTPEEIKRFKDLCEKQQPVGNFRANVNVSSKNIAEELARHINENARGTM